MQGKSQNESPKKQANTQKEVAILGHHIFQGKCQTQYVVSWTSVQVYLLEVHVQLH